MEQSIFPYFQAFDLLLASQSIMVTWENVPLQDRSFIPKITNPVRTLLLEHYLVVFNDNGDSSEKITFFDLKEKQWLRVKLAGDAYNPSAGSSICLSDNNAIVMFGADTKEDILSVLSFSRGDGRGLFLVTFINL